jgi:hypothetical protein
MSISEIIITIMIFVIAGGASIAITIWTVQRRGGGYTKK